MTNPQSYPPIAVTGLSVESGNPQRGEITVYIDSRPLKMCLTLGSLAQLEQWSGGDLRQLFSRFEQGKAQLSDSLMVLRAGMLGAAQTGFGDKEQLEFIDQLPVSTCLSECLDAVRQILAVSFNVSEADSASDNALTSAPTLKDENTDEGAAHD